MGAALYRDQDRGSDRDRGAADREDSSDLRRHSGGAARCSAVTSYERRRWLRDGGRGRGGGAGLSRRGECCCGVSIVNFSVLFFLGAARRQREQPPTAFFFFFSFADSPGQAGDENTPLPVVRIAKANFVILEVRDFACFCGSKYAPSM